MQYTEIFSAVKSKNFTRNNDILNIFYIFKEFLINQVVIMIYVFVLDDSSTS